MRRSLLFTLVLALFGAVPLMADTPEIQPGMQQFKTAHPQAQFFGKQYFDGEGFFEQVGTADVVYGTVLSTGTSPENSALDLCEQLEGIYAEEIGDLVPGTQHGVMWNKATETYKFQTFRFNQTMAGVPVFRSGIGFLVRNEENFPVVMASNNFKEMKGFNAVAAAFVQPKATAAMIVSAGKMMEQAGPFQGAEKIASVLDTAKRQKPLPVQVSEERLVVWAGVTNVRTEPELAVVFIAERGSSRELNTYQKHLVVAAVDNGEVLYSENQVVADVSGTASGRATDSDAALECDPAVPYALPYAQLSIVGGNTVFADVNGNFNIPDGTNGNVTVRSPLRGQFFEVFDDAAGGSQPSMDISVNAPGNVDILHNPNATEFSTSNVNCYIRANVVRDFVLSFEPNFPTIANQTFFDVTSNNDNLSGFTSCNATYTGNAINFMRNLGNCNNTSIADVIYHEYGHHLVSETGNGQGQFGEGSGDVMGVLIRDNPVLGFGFVEGQCNSGIRSANNFRTYPCTGEIHDCGQLISGCVWDCRNEIATVDPANALDITSGLFLGMLIARGQMVPGNGTIDPLVTLLFLELDDDDGNISNGTPHYVQIAAAFNAHNMDAPPLAAIDITFPQGLPQMIDPDGGTEFEVDVAAIISNPVAGSGILHVDDGNGFQQVALVQNSPTNYSAVFPATDCGNEVSFYVTFDAENGETVAQPIDAPTNTFSTISAVSVSVAFADSFDTDTGWTVSGDASDGQWERGIPNNGDRGDPSVDAEATGAGNCFLTDNDNAGNDNTDVDGGSTILTSPVLDASITVDEEAFVSYYRWYDNSFGGSPFADVFVVEISNNGGASWSNLETVGPAGPEVSGGWNRKQFRIADFVTPTNNMRIRFNASDLGDGSVIEAGVDGVEVQIVNCVDDVLLGDVNMDGVINLLDVQFFVDILSNGEFLAEADINEDGVVNLLDVPLFVALLSGG